MKYPVYIFISIIIAGLLFDEQVEAQGIVRAQGVGLRVSFWNISGRRSTINVDTQNGMSSVDLSGIGPTFYYFSRAYRDLFLETSLGIVSSIRTDHSSSVNSSVQIESIVPFLVGLRYDLLSTRLSGALHPYIGAGVGPYSAFNLATTVTADGSANGVQEKIESTMEYGWYAGGGVNFTLANWFALNADIKYHSVNMQPIRNYSGVELGLGFSFMWGKKRELYEIKQIQVVVDDIYPAYHQIYTTFPIALVGVKNLAGYPIEVNIRSVVKGYSPGAKDSGFIKLGSGEMQDIPVTVYFGRQMLENYKSNTVILDMELEVRAATTLRERLNVPIVIHSRNAWNGDMMMLPSFLTPEVEQVRDFVRHVALDLVEETPGMETFSRAKAIFDSLAARKIRYLPDPNIPFYRDDRVQFAEETLDAGSGDCDDLAVLYASLLESLGIHTAFVEVRDPEKELAHVYLLFNSALTSESGYLISENEKRYILREGPSGKMNIWIPVETTLLESGFAVAWNEAALAYLQEAQLRNGLADGWVKIIDHH